MTEQEVVRHYYSGLVGWLELRTSAHGVRSISFISQPAVPETSWTNAIMEQLIDELDRYFAGNLAKFAVPLDPASGTPFQRLVWQGLTEIPYGETRSYAEVASAVGHPAAARAVGSANRCNDIPILIPCHRVIKSDGTLGGFASGLKIKKTLLGLEGIAT